MVIYNNYNNNKNHNQKGGVIPDLSVEENIEIYQQNVALDESLRSTLNQLIAIRDCNNSINLQMLGFKIDNPDLNLLIQKKISTLITDGECNSIDLEGNILSLRNIAAASVIPSAAASVIPSTASGSQPRAPVYNPRRNISSNRPPASMPRTQSGFYMPLITEAYYRAKGLAVPQYILDISGRVINLRQDIINQDTYNQMVNALTAYLRVDENLAKLEYNYRIERRQPNVNSEGHIPGAEQEDLLSVVNLGGLSLQIMLEQAIQIHYLS